MNRTLAFGFASIALFTASAFVAEAAKPGGGGGGGGGTPTGTIYFEGPAGMMAMNPDGTGKVAVLPTVPPGHPLNQDGTEPIGLIGSPCDQVYGSDSKQDRWYLWLAKTGTYDKVILANGAEYQPSDPSYRAHFDVFAYRTNPSNRSEVEVVQVTDFFGLGWGRLSGWGNVNWSNDSNESAATSYIGSWVIDVRGCYYVDEVTGEDVLDFRLDPTKSSSTMRPYRLPVTASEIQASWLLGDDLNWRPSDPAEMDDILVAHPGGQDASPDGANYVVAEGRTLVVRAVLNGAWVRTLWDGSGSTQPKYPGAAVWSRDGSKVVFMNNGNNSPAYDSSDGVWSVSDAGGTPVALVKDTMSGKQWTYYSGPLSSPDSQFFSVNSGNWQFAGGAWNYGAPGDVLRVSASGGTLTNLTGDTATRAKAWRWVSNAIAP